MTMAAELLPFQPKADRPEWRIIYDELLEDADFGAIITYGDLTRVLGRRFETSRTPIYRARIHLGEMRKRWLESVAGIGYRVIEAREHIDVAQAHKRRAKRQLGMMVRVADVTDISRLSPDELLRFDTQQKVNAMLYMVAVHHERRLSRIEDILRSEGRM